jgi:citrate lyase subunit beta / citryl-CoA lyase
MSDWSPGPAWLFCPADRPDRYRKALAIADIVILDLEDAVAPADKARARRCLHELSAIGDFDRARTVVRVNAATTEHHAADLSTIHEVGANVVMLAKAETAASVEPIEALVIPILETPLGVRRADELAASPNAVGLMWGAEDLAASLGATGGRWATGAYRDASRFARMTTLVAAKAANRLALDSVYFDLEDLDGLGDESGEAAASGFDATVAVHPRQVPVIRARYAPSPEEVAWAGRLFAEVGPDRGVTTFEGRMVDGPVYRLAETILRRATLTHERGN